MDGGAVIPTSNPLPLSYAPPRPLSRLLFIDNLRAAMIVLVVTIHAAVTYSGVGSWYYTENNSADVDRPSLLLFLIYETHIQAFFMGLLFLVAGYFTPAAYDRKGARRFIADRAVRLGGPTVLYALLIHPLLVYGLTKAQSRQHSTLAGFYLDYFERLGFLSGTGPLWFAAALLVFSIAYAGFRLASHNPSPRPTLHVPSTPALFPLGLIIAVTSFLIRVRQPIGSSVLNMQLCFFAQYVILFCAGTVAYRHDALTAIPRRRGFSWLIAALLLGPPLWAATLCLGGLFTTGLDPFAGGWHWQSAAYATWESLFCVFVSGGLITLFREKLNRQGPFARYLSANAFAVYVFHAPVLVAIALAMRSLHAPPLLKFVLLSSLGLAASFLLSSLVLRRIPPLRRLLV
jgi:glucan biosynthesis protein C